MRVAAGADFLPVSKPSESFWNRLWPAARPGDRHVAQAAAPPAKPPARGGFGMARRVGGFPEPRSAFLEKLPHLPGYGKRHIEIFRSPSGCGRPAGIMADFPMPGAAGLPPIFISAFPSGICANASNGAPYPPISRRRVKENRPISPPAFLSACLPAVPPSSHHAGDAKPKAPPFSKEMSVFAVAFPEHFISPRERALAAALAGYANGVAADSNF